MTLPVLILATGPTSKKFGVDLFRGKAFVIAVNDAYRLCPWADMIYACDYDWWCFHAAYVRGLQGEKVTLRHDVNIPVIGGVREVPAIKFPRRGFSAGPEIFMGHNSGYQALQIAAGLSNKIWLAGFDMGATGNTHFFGDHPPQLANGSDYKLFVEDFEESKHSINSLLDVTLLTAPSGLAHLFKTSTPEAVLS